MNTEYLPSFVKDLKALKTTPIYKSIKELVFEEVPNLSRIEDIRNLKKLKGYESAYRIRAGDYRIGLTFDRETIVFSRVLHRRDIYRYFP